MSLPVNTDNIRLPDGSIYQPGGPNNNYSPVTNPQSLLPEGSDPGTGGDAVALLPSTDGTTVPLDDGAFTLDPGTVQVADLTNADSFGTTQLDLTNSDDSLLTASITPESNDYSQFDATTPLPDTIDSSQVAFTDLGIGSGSGSGSDAFSPDLVALGGGLDLGTQPLLDFNSFLPLDGSSGSTGGGDDLNSNFVASSDLSSDYSDFLS